MLYVTSYDPSKYLCMNENIELGKKEKTSTKENKKKTL